MVMSSRATSLGLKTSLWLLCALPMAELTWRAVTNALGTNPQEALLRATGTWCLVLLLVTLGVTPLRRWANWPDLIRVRRLLGLWTFTYAVVHLLCFWAFEHEFVWRSVLSDGLKRPFVTVGLIAFVFLMPMAMTSNTMAMRALGANWKKLHRLIYVIAILACVHFILHRAGKNNYADPIIVSLITAGLFGARLLFRNQRR
jgi:methionine sulfoxide reductase heme-binding subunit